MSVAHLGGLGDEFWVVPLLGNDLSLGGFVRFDPDSDVVTLPPAIMEVARSVSEGNLKFAVYFHDWSEGNQHSSS